MLIWQVVRCGRLGLDVHGLWLGDRGGLGVETRVDRGRIRAPVIFVVDGRFVEVLVQKLVYKQKGLIPDSNVKACQPI